MDTYDWERVSLNRQNVYNSIQEDLRTSFNELNLEEVQKKRCASMKIGNFQDYQEKIISLSDERKLICGIRHLGCNPKLPFIHIVPNFSLKNKKEALDIGRILYQEFSIFHPKTLCFWSKTKVEVDRPGVLYLVARSEDIQARSFSNSKDIFLKKVEDQSYYNWYQCEYEKFHLQFPHLKWTVTVNSQDIMEQSRKEGLLYYGVVNDEIIGLIAAVRSNFLGHSGLYFNEIYLTSKWRGQKLAPILQRRFILEQASPREIIWGTIDAENLPSLKTALSNGRFSVRFENFVKL